MNRPGAAARAARDEGMVRAAEHAESVHPRWVDQATDVLLDFLTIGEIAGGVEFTSEDVRDHADQLGLPKPPHLRAWGPVFRRVAKTGRIVKVGTAEAKAAHVHCGIIAVWRVE